jgi:linoleoyl-CoA desaturase
MNSKDHDGSPRRGVRFKKDPSFREELQRRVDAHIASCGLANDWALHIKALVVMLWLFLSYSALVFVASTPIEAAAAAGSTALAMYAAAVNILHDAAHGAFAYRWLNKLLSLTLDLLGGSSYIWKLKHNQMHHSHVNLDGLDDDINCGPIARLSPHQPRLRFHRFQHIYMWPLYCLLSLKWQFYGDVATLVNGAVGRVPLKRPTGVDCIVVMLGKVVFFGLAIGLPLLRHPVSNVLLAFLGVSCVFGFLMSCTFQLAHCVEEAAHPRVADETLNRPWAEHQVEATLDFCPRSTVLFHLIGGLNLQTEHHLFPHLPHTYYPAIARIVEATCKEFGVQYHMQPTLLGALRSHYRFLRALGARE